MKTVLLGQYVDVIEGKLIEKGAVIVEGEKILYVGKEADASAFGITESDKIIRTSGTILPGFIDCHAHIAGMGDGYVTAPRERMVLKAAYDLGCLLESGFTAARDMTSISGHMKWGVENGYVKGPRLMPGGQLLSVTAGHGEYDATMPYSICKDNMISYLIDGPQECYFGVRKQFRNGAEFIKISATGGVSSTADGLDDVQFSEEELKVIVEEAQRHGTYVAAHCSGLAGAKQALKAGVKSIEHGIHLDEECITIMKENGCSLVTTLWVSLNVAKMEGLPDVMKAKAALCAERNLKSIALAHKAGINIALGTDFDNDEGSSTGFQHIGREFTAICEAGFSEMEALQIGTINGAKLMGKADQIGSLEMGKLADIVVVKGNPLENITVLGDADNISFVMKDGIIYKED